MAVWNPFDSTNGFWDLIALTDFFNQSKWRIGQAMGLNLVNWESAPTVKVAIDRITDDIGLLDPIPRGAPAPQINPDKGDVVDVRSFRIAGEQTITADSLRDLRIYGTEGQMRGIAAARAKAVDKIGRYLDGSLEHYVLGVLQGIVKKPSDASTILSSYTLFNKSQANEVNLELDETSALGKTLKALNGIVQAILDELGEDAAFVDHVHCFTDAVGMANLVGSAEFRESYKFYDVAEMIRQGNVFRPITWGGVTFEQYRLGNSGFAGGSFLGTGKFVFFPVMQDITDSIFQGRWIPSDTIPDLELPGQRRYMRSKMDQEFEGAPRWVGLMGECNPLLYCRKPNALRRGDDGV